MTLPQAQDTGIDVCFPIMPFADAGRPSMGVSLLAAEVQAAGFSTETLYFNLDLAAEMGLADYQKVASSYPPNLLLGEWMFADDVFGDEIPPATDYLADIFAPYGGRDPELLAAIRAVRARRADYLDACTAEILARRPRVVGFSTVFHQTCACLAVARRLKERPDPPLVVFGGPNCEGEMGLELVRSFPWIDYACSGEADLSFPRLLDRLLGGAPATPIPGVLERGVARAPERSQAVPDLDALPFPDFDGYFARLAASPLAGQFEGHLVFETSRGCWWGAKHHCTFCGLNGDTLAFRAKTPERAFAEIDYLTQHYGSRRIGCVDNILDMRYLTTLLPRLAAAGHDLELFYEVKANLRLPQLRQLRAGGVTQIQPGIESFSDQVLKLMNKGVTGLQNIQLMRWSREVGIEVSWNILAGFPGEDPAQYAAMAELIPRLTHLDPPCSCGMLRLDRFSPFHERASEYGLVRVRPARAYYYCFPLGRQALARIAYFFDHDYADGRDPDTYCRPVQHAAAEWVATRAGGAAEAPRLDATFADDGAVTIEDTRPAALAPRHVLTGLAARLYARCDSATPEETLIGESAGRPDASREAVLAALDHLDARRLIVRRDGQVLSLAVFRQRPEPRTDPLPAATPVGTPLRGATPGVPTREAHAHAAP